MPGGGKKAVFPPLHLHDHDHPIRINDYDRQKKFLQNRGKSLELKEGLDRTEGPTTATVTSAKNKSGKSQFSGGGKSSAEGVGRLQNGKSDTQKPISKSEQKALHKLEQQQIKSEQKAQQKLEKEQSKLEKEQSKSKSSSKSQDRHRSTEHPFASVREYPQLKAQKSIDLSCLKHHKSLDGSGKHPARKSVDLQYRQNLLDPTSSSSADFASSFSSIHLKSKK